MEIQIKMIYPNRYQTISNRCLLWSSMVTHTLPQEGLLQSSCSPPPTFLEWSALKHVIFLDSARQGNNTLPFVCKALLKDWRLWCEGSLVLLGSTALPFSVRFCSPVDDKLPHQPSCSVFSLCSLRGALYPPIVTLYPFIRSRYTQCTYPTLFSEIFVYQCSHWARALCLLGF